MRSVQRDAIAAVLALSASAGWHATPAQQAPALVEWQRVRVTATAAGLSNSVFALRSVTPDSVVLIRQPSPGRLDTVRLARGAVQTLEVSKGHRSLALVGLILGAGVGVAWGAQWATHASNPGMLSQMDNAPGILLRVGIAAFAGALGGGLVRHERWVAVPLEAVRIVCVPGRGGAVRVGASAAF